MKTRAQQLLETSGLDVQPAENTPALSPQMQSPPGNDLQNNKGYDISPGTNTLQGGWVVNDKPQSTQTRNAGMSRYSGQPGDANANPYSGHSNESFPVSRAVRVMFLLREAQVLPPQQQASSMRRQQTPMTTATNRPTPLPGGEMSGGIERAAKKEINDYLTRGRAQLSMVAARRDILAKNMALKATQE